MLRGMSSEEFHEWWVLDQKIEPFGEYRRDIRVGLAMSPLLNLLRLIFFKDDSFSSKAEDWLFRFAKAIPSKVLPDDMSDEQMENFVRGLAKAYKAAEQVKLRKKSG